MKSTENHPHKIPKSQNNKPCADLNRRSADVNVEAVETAIWLEEMTAMFWALLASGQRLKIFRFLLDFGASRRLLRVRIGLGL